MAGVVAKFTRIAAENRKKRIWVYPVAFSYSEKKYVWNETGINMVENLYTALNLYNADGDTGSLLKFMREEIKTNKKIANWYNFDGSVKTKMNRRQCML